MGSATRQGRRRIFLIESRDFLHWSEPRPILAPDPALDNIDDAFYGMTPLRLGGQWVGFLNVFHMVSNTMDVQLVHSRDGRVWRRIAPGRPWLQRGAPGSWNEFMVTVPSPPVALGDELWVYHGGSKNHHDWWFAGGNEARDYPEAWRGVPEVWDWDAVGYGLGLARLRRDGFVSLGANPVREGVLVTQPLLSWGDTLVVNAACRGHGSLRAEMLDEAGAVIPGLPPRTANRFTATPSSTCCAGTGVPTCAARRARGRRRSPASGASASCCATRSCTRSACAAAQAPDGGVRVCRIAVVVPIRQTPARGARARGGSAMNRPLSSDQLPATPSRADLAWRDHWVMQHDGAGGQIGHPAAFRFLPWHGDRPVFPWGLAVLDNGGWAVAGVAGSMTLAQSNQTVIGLSDDQGASWRYVEVPNCSTRPMMLSNLGSGVLSFMSSWSDEGNFRFYSHDHGATWERGDRLPPAPDGTQMDCEGNALIDRDAAGNATVVAETGQTMSKGPLPQNPCCGCIRWSDDGGRTWGPVSWPQEWVWYDDFDGERVERGVGEGALVRAANGSIVAAVRTDMPARYIPLHYDNFEGTAVSISTDEGATWTPMDYVFGPGRHHVTLLRLPNDDLVLTVIRRIDFGAGDLATYRRGCDAVVSHDHGATWDLEHRYVVDDFAALGTERWFEVACGHQFSVSVGDGSVLTAYGNYRNAGALIRWRPAA